MFLQKILKKLYNDKIIMIKSKILKCYNAYDLHIHVRTSQ